MIETIVTVIFFAAVGIGVLIVLGKIIFSMVRIAVDTAEHLIQGPPKDFQYHQEAKLPERPKKPSDGPLPIVNNVDPGCGF